MIDTFPKVFSKKAIRIYLALLVSTLVMARSNATMWYFMVIGLLSVYAFFHYSSEIPVRWHHLDSLRFEKKLFKTAFVIRLAFVLISSVFYIVFTDSIFGFEFLDAVGYHEQGMNGHWLIVNSPPDYWRCMCGGGDYADSGYSMYLSLVYTIFGDNVLPARVIKAILGAAMCALVYKLASRNFDEATGRMSGIMLMLMPNALYYCGSHLKETEMVFLVLLFAERADYALRSRSNLWHFVGAFLIAGIVFFFRTALAVVLIVAFVMAGLMTSRRILGAAKRGVMIIAAIVGSVIILGSGIAADITHEWGRKDEQSKNYEWRSEREGGNYFFRYASAAVFAPLIFTIPFPTMVGIPGQEHTQMVHGGNFVKNIISIFTILALFGLLKKGKWRENVLILAIMLGYLAVLCVSQFAQSERFHYPAMPFIVMFAAYGITHLKGKHIRYYRLWLIAMFVAGLGWNYIKLKGRGMI